ncbi:MAG TPA: hypothetical protein DD640_07970 [Clostridiales bacterium]|nr:hypothetical protein [Clostridiales bacterium]
MSQMTNNRRSRAIRRIVAVFLIMVAIPAAWLIYVRTRNRSPEVRAAVLSQGNITSVMTITTVIRPGAIQKTSVGRQLVNQVHVQLGDQVEKGDPLITFDLQEFEDQLAAAAELREQAEAAAEKAAELVGSQSDDSQQSLADLQKQLSRLSAGLSGATSALAKLNNASPAELVIQEDLAEALAEQLAAIDPESPDAPAELRQLLETLTAGIQISGGETYQEQLSALGQNVSKMSSSLSGLTGSLGNADLAALLSGGAASQLSGLVTSAQTAVAQAAQAEELARQALEAAVEVIYAETDGIVAQINAVKGQYAGTAGTSLNSSISSSLGSLLGSSGTGSLGSLTSSQTPVVVIYDNTRPKAFFQANRYDSAKLAVGMPVTYRQDNQTWTGQITYKARIASNMDFGGSSGDSLLGSVSSASGLSAEPMIDLEMSLEGEGLTQLTLGFNLDAEIQTASAEDVLLLPAEAMKKELGEYYVFVIDSAGKLSRRAFVPGIQSELFAEVLSGLQAGDRVVLNPTNDLRDGMAVRVIADG